VWLLFLREISSPLIPLWSLPDDMSAILDSSSVNRQYTSFDGYLEFLACCTREGRLLRRHAWLTMLHMAGRGGESLGISLHAQWSRVRL
jgi:hypothetical protein